ncbi:hypothetical protein WA1_30140 [Scytonema hofmannii PCC 7110]|uniref:Uncharacterized protein n=1 Tax=Scytonema hofmannii PCC 7110 TaxID=128403 RepID=A0A139X4K4_9CYAN|nr:hypothetical protein [Scytonema hofmannii]KYC39606.1 hypothetical protein WA1_30140 [Scytonema hofmannii PCC 7110]
MNAAPTVTIYKAPQKGKGQKFLKDGFQPTDFPYMPPNADGKCYFAAPNSRSLAEEYNKYYKDGVLEVTIDREIYDEYFKPLEKPYQGGSQIELPIPQSLFPVLNKFPRILKPQ